MKILFLLILVKEHGLALLQLNLLFQYYKMFCKCGPKHINNLTRKFSELHTTLLYYMRLWNESAYPPPLPFLLQEGPIKLVDSPKVHGWSSWTDRQHILQECPNHQDLRREFRTQTSWPFKNAENNIWVYFTKQSVIIVYHQQHTRRRKEGNLISYTY